MSNSNSLRVKYLYFFFLFLFLLVTTRIIYLQIFKKNFFQNLARRQHYQIVPLEGRRGKIFDTHGRVLARGLVSYSIFADPFLIEDIDATATLLAANLGVPSDKIKARLQKKKRFIWLKRKISLPEKEKIQTLDLRGIGFIREEDRFYPQDRLSSSVLGVVDIDNKGLGGIELSYDRFLRGKDGRTRILQDSFSHDIFLSPEIIEPQEGADIVLTIDAQLQYWVENYLEEGVKSFSALGGSVVMMDADTGAVLALANYPFFNPNSLNETSSDSMRNRAVCDMFEPGSVFKIVTLVAALEEKAFKESDIIYCENGAYKIPGTILHDYKPNGALDFRGVFKKSSNIGVGKIAAVLGKQKIYRYIKKMGFGEKTGIDLPGEITGVVKPLSQWSNTSPYIIPIGQEVGVNLFHLVRAFAVIANGGYLVQPHIVKATCFDAFCKEVPEQRKRVISLLTAIRAKNILLSVVKEGTGKGAAVENVRIGGKTGTAQKYDFALKKYSSSKYRASFVGFIDEPNVHVVIGVSIDEPARSHLGGMVASPVFKKIAEKSVKYLGTNRYLVRR